MSAINIELVYIGTKEGRPLQPVRLQQSYGQELKEKKQKQQLDIDEAVAHRWHVYCESAIRIAPVRDSSQFVASHLRKNNSRSSTSSSLKPQHPSSTTSVIQGKTPTPSPHRSSRCIAAFSIPAPFPHIQLNFFLFPRNCVLFIP